LDTQDDGQGGVVFALFVFSLFSGFFFVFLFRPRFSFIKRKGWEWNPEGADGWRFALD
jgi:hypothetical protein